LDQGFISFREKFVIDRTACAEKAADEIEEADHAENVNWFLSIFMQEKNHN
jgi:hypothetical protein